MVTCIDFSSFESVDEIVNFLKSYDEAFIRNAAHLIDDWRSDSKELLFHTSGSSGPPKPIHIPKSFVRASINKTAEVFDLIEGCSLYNPLPIEFVAGKMMWLRAFELKAKLYVAQPGATPEMPEAKLHFAAFTPHQLIHLIEDKVEQLHHIEKILLGGMGLFPYLKNKIIEHNLNVWIGYGMTETVSHIALHKIEHKSEQTTYKALPGVLFSTHGDNQLKISVSYFDDLIVETNDVVELLSDKEMLFVGRVDRIINSGGRKIQPELLEEKINLVLNKPFYLCGKADESLGEKLILMIEGEENLFQNELTDLFANWDKKEVPKEIIYKKSFQRTDTGKIIKKYYE